MIQDSSLKELLVKHFWAQRAFVQPEVDVYYGEGTSGAQKLITDVDVYALVPRRDLTYARVLGDCRTLKSQSPAARALWLRGLLVFVEGSSGLILLKAGAPIERDHKLAATSVGIQLMNADDFKVYDRAVIYPEGSSKENVSMADFRQLARLNERYPNVLPLLEYLYRDCWRERTFGERIRHTLAAVRQVSRELDPSKQAHLAIVCDATATFAVGVAECAATIFHQYLHPTGKEELADALKVLVWGGSEQYHFYQKVRDKLLRSKGPFEQESDLELPRWPDFLQLLRNVLENPGIAFQVPWLLRSAAIDFIRGTQVLSQASPTDLLLLKFGMLAVDYVCRASYLPADFGKLLQAPFVRLQADLALSLSKSASARAGEEPKQIQPASLESGTQESASKTDSKPSA
jgi:hypothetical protein